MKGPGEGEMEAGKSVYQVTAYLIRTVGAPKSNVPIIKHQIASQFIFSLPGAV